MNFNAITMFADAGGTATGGFNWGSIIMIVALIAVFVLMWRSNKKQEREQAEMRNSLEVGDEITTIGGIMGRVVTVKDDSIVIETGADRTKLKFQRWAIQTNNTANDRMAAERKAAEDAKKAKSEKAAIDEKVNGKKSKKTIEVKNDDIPAENVNDIPEEDK